MIGGIVTDVTAGSPPAVAQFQITVPLTVLTKITVTAPGYRPWGVAIPAGGKDERIEGPDWSWLSRGCRAEGAEKQDRVANLDILMHAAPERAISDQKSWSPTINGP
jgi:hypothetical protein